MLIDLKKYLGKWFEICRIPVEFETGIQYVTAEYSLNSDNSIKVVNSGYIGGEFKTIEGIAIPTEEDDLFKVSFFPNVYSDYKILAIADDYAYSLVGGSSPDYLWILGRIDKIPKRIFDWFVLIASDKGYNVNKLEITKGYGGISTE